MTTNHDVVSVEDRACSKQIIMIFNYGPSVHKMMVKVKPQLQYGEP